MSLFAIASAKTKKSYPAWLAAAIVALGLHIAVVIAFYWQPHTTLNLPPAAAPQAFEVSMVASPKNPITEQAIGQLQQVSAPAPQQQSEPLPKAEVVEQIEPIAKHKSDFMVKKVVKTSEPTTKVEEQPENKPESTSSEAQVEVNSDTTAEHYVDTSSAPIATKNQQTETASAPQIGALSEQESTAIATWQSDLAAHLERRKRYPRQAQIRGQQGVPWVNFTLDRQGRVLAVKLHRASGISALDREVIALVKRAQPLPIPPESTPDNALNISVPVAFFIQ